MQHTSCHSFFYCHCLRSILTHLFTFILVFNTAAQENLLSNGDGPYIFYRNDSMVIKQIVSRFANPIGITNVYPIAAKKDMVLQVKFSNRRKWNFEVKLQPEIVYQRMIWDAPVKLLALSDIEGEFSALRSLFIGNKVMDKNYNWIYGTGHVVICGDLFDRGFNVTEQLWLLYKLEQDAVAKGGYLHIILGNHDIMNLSGDVRYVQPRYIQNAAIVGKPYPALFAEDTELGRWLRSKNIVEKIGDFLCLHAGISPAVQTLNYSVERINTLARPYYSKGDPDSIGSDPVIGPLFTNDSPFWYRGYFISPRATQSQVDSTLSFYQVKTIVIGHTIAAKNITGYYQNKVLGIGVNHHAGVHQAAYFEKNTWYKVGIDGKKTLLFSVY